MFDTLCYKAIIMTNEQLEKGNKIKESISKIDEVLDELRGADVKDEMDLYFSDRNNSWSSIDLFDLGVGADVMNLVCEKLAERRNALNDEFIAL